METILTLKKGYSNKIINLLFKSMVTKDKVLMTIHKMIESNDYNTFFDLQDKYNVTVEVTKLNDKFSILVSTDDDYIVLSLSSLEVVQIN